MSCQIEPSGDRVVLREDTPEEQTASGLIIPAVAQEKTKTGTVLATGPKCTFYNEGDHVAHTRYAGIEFELEGVKYTIVSEEELLGRIPAFAPPSEAEAEETLAI